MGTGVQNESLTFQSQNQYLTAKGLNNKLQLKGRYECRNQNRRDLSLHRAAGNEGFQEQLNRQKSEFHDSHSFQRMELEYPTFPLGERCNIDAAALKNWVLNQQQLHGN